MRIFIDFIHQYSYSFLFQSHFLKNILKMRFWSVAFQGFFMQGYLDSKISSAN